MEENLQRRRRRWGEEEVKEKGKKSKEEGKTGGKESGREKKFYI